MLGRGVVKPTKKRGSEKEKLPIKFIWCSNLERLVIQTPIAGTWVGRLQVNGVYRCLAADGILGLWLDHIATHTRVARSNCPSNATSSTAHALKIVQGFVTLHSWHAAQASLPRPIINFEIFLVASAVAVLDAYGYPINELCDVLRGLLGYEARMQYCKDMIACARFLNRLIGELELVGWSHRACELIMIWNQHLTFFQSATVDPAQSLRVMVGRLRNRSPRKEESERFAWTPIIVPAIVRNMLGDVFTVAETWHALGYRYAHVFEGLP